MQREIADDELVKWTCKLTRVCVCGHLENSDHGSEIFWLEFQESRWPFTAHQFQLHFDPTTISRRPTDGEKNESEFCEQFFSP